MFAVVAPLLAEPAKPFLDDGYQFVIARTAIPILDNATKCVPLFEFKRLDRGQFDDESCGSAALPALRTDVCRRPEARAGG